MCRFYVGYVGFMWDMWDVCRFYVGYNDELVRFYVGYVECDRLPTVVYAIYFYQCLCSAVCVSCICGPWSYWLCV